MIKNHSINIQIKYLISGILFGMLFPAVAWTYELVSRGLTLSFDNCKMIIDYNPMIIMITTAPVFLGLFALVGGINHAKVITEKEELIKVTDLLKARTNELNAINASMTTEIDEHKTMHTIIDNLAHHDFLTGLHNRLFLSEKLEFILSKSYDADKKFAMMYMDLDDFKIVNDMYGHSIGDELLKAIANRLINTFRKNDLIIRMGGDEFVIILEIADDIKNIEVAAAKVCDLFKQPFSINDKNINITASIGIFIFPTLGYDCNAIIEEADKALYHAKRTGKNNYKFSELK